MYPLNFLNDLYFRLSVVVNYPNRPKSRDIMPADAPCKADGG